MSEHVDVPTTELPQEPPRRRHGLVAPIATALAVVLVAGGGFAAWHFLADPGPQPDAVLPASTFAMATLDLDPSGGQKIEALKALRKFPSLREKLSADSDTDLMKNLVDSALEDSKACKSLSYDRDFAPWIGQTVAVGGVVLGDGKPTWVVAVEANDPEKARSSYAAVAECSAKESGTKTGWTVSGDYVLMSDTQNHADVIASAGQEAPLASDAAYQKWMGEAGDPGVASFYVSKKAPEVAATLVDETMKGIGGAGAGGALSEKDKQEILDSLPPTMSQAEKEKFLEQMTGAQPTPSTTDSEKSGDSVRTTFKDFTGMAGVLRFADGGFELSTAAGGLRGAGTATVGDQVTHLPGDTMAALAVATPKDLATNLSDQAKNGALSMFLPPTLLEEAGLSLPEDLQTLLGSALSVSVGGDAPADLASLESPADLPLGVLVKSDPAKFQDVLAKVEKVTGMKLADVPATLKADGDRVAIASTSAYADDLVKGGSLGDDAAFKDVVPHADKAGAVAFVQLDGQWRAALKKAASSSNDKEVREVLSNLDVVRAVGASAWVDGATSHGLVRITLR